jgi:hypothetical protein
MKYRYEPIVETRSILIYKNDILIGQQSNWETIEAGIDWATLIVNDLNNGINEDAFMPPKPENGEWVFNEEMHEWVVSE